MILLLFPLAMGGVDSGLLFFSELRIYSVEFYLIRGTVLDVEAEVERVDELLHGAFAYTAHVEAPRPYALSFHRLQFVGVFPQRLHTGLHLVFGGDVSQEHKHTESQRHGIVDEEVAGNHLTAEKAAYESESRSM